MQFTKGQYLKFGLDVIARVKKIQKLKHGGRVKVRWFNIQSNKRGVYYLDPRKMVYFVNCTDIRDLAIAIKEDL